MILGWKNKDMGAVLSDGDSSLRSSGGTDIRKIPHVANRVCDGWLTDTHHHSKPMNQYRIRRLTPLECERLQGFPDGWTEGLSDTRRYKTLGNAVTVPVIEYIGRAILQAAGEEGATA